MNKNSNIRTILSYNVLEGLQGSEVQIDVFVRWVQELDPDIIFYQELNNFTQESFKAMAERYRHPYSFKFSELNYRPGISSKYELSNTNSVSNDLTLGYISAKVQGVHLFCLHLDPFTEEKRLAEMARILDDASSLPDNAKVMLVGDFNSLARSDRDVYNGDFEKQLRERCPDWGVEFDVTDAVLNAGYVDAYPLFHSEFKRTFPTLKRIVPGDAAVRIDYAFLNPALKEDCISAEIVDDPITRFLSDHYPLMVKFKNQ